MKKSILLLLTISTLLLSSCKSTKEITQIASPKKVSDNYWQQHVDYTMDIAMDVSNYQYKGTQKLVYTNNSPDTLKHVYYHLYFNAFQPNSEMDIRSRSIEDPDGRVKDRISKLKPDEIGYIKVKSLKQNGTSINHKTEGTILEVDLAKPILPGETVTFDMTFDAQVPNQIRRSGRDNKEGVAFSMTQWYPKMAEYDRSGGWTATPYIAREFNGVWGDFDVTIHIDKDYVLGGTGYLQNPDEIGYGYQEDGKEVKHKTAKLAWHFKAPNVHDFTWVADKDFVHDKKQVPNGPIMHFLYKKGLEDNWRIMEPKAVKAMEYYSKHIGKYPYKQYSVIQGGDGGMEYAMCTLITGEREPASLAGVVYHEMAHTWFQFLLASDEGKYPWMDEGMTSYISDLAQDKIESTQKDDPTQNAYGGYYYLVKSGKEEPLSTHADHYNTNLAYGIGSYNKGEVYIAQLEYIIGKENLAKTLKRYFEEWKFKHPTPTDFKHVAEKVSGIHLEWYKNEWLETTHTIDYALTVGAGNNSSLTTVDLKRDGTMAMPIDIIVKYTDGTMEYFYIPLREMHGEKPNPFGAMKRTVLKDWDWAHPDYNFTIPVEKSKIALIIIDPLNRMADINKENNIFEAK